MDFFASIVGFTLFIDIERLIMSNADTVASRNHHNLWNYCQSKTQVNLNIHDL